MAGRLADAVACFGAMASLIALIHENPVPRSADPREIARATTADRDRRGTFALVCFVGSCVYLVTNVLRACLAS